MYDQLSDLDELLRKRRIQIIYYILGSIVYFGIMILLHFYVCERFFTSFITILSGVPVTIVLISIWTYRESQVKKWVEQFKEEAEEDIEYEEQDYG